MVGNPKKFNKEKKVQVCDATKVEETTIARTQNDIDIRKRFEN